MCRPRASDCIVETSRGRKTSRHRPDRALPDERAPPRNQRHRNYQPHSGGGPARGPRSADRRRPEQFHGLGRVQLSSGTSSRWPARPGVSATCARHGHVMLRHGGKRYAADLTEVALAQRAQVIRASAHRPSPPGRPMVRTGEPGCCGAVRSVRSASVDRASHRSASRLQHRSSVSCVTTVA